MALVIIHQLVDCPTLLLPLLPLPPLLLPLLPLPPLLLVVLVLVLLLLWHQGWGWWQAAAVNLLVLLSRRCRAGTPQ